MQRTKFFDIRVPVIRDGTNRRNRTPGQLSPDHARIEDRTSEEFIEFAKELSKAIRYYDPKKPNVVENWEHFFTGDLGSGQNHQPHYGLYKAFLELFRYSRKSINTLTKKHLDYYYQEVLRFRKKKEVPDQVNIIVELAKNVYHHLLKEGTLFYAGKDSHGKDLFYRLIKDSDFNVSQVTDLKTLYLQKSTRTYKAAKKEDGETHPDEISLASVDEIHGQTITRKAEEPLEELEPWQALGSNTSPAIEIGWAIASPVLLMHEGQRKVIVNITGRYLGEEERLQDFQLTSQDLKVYFTGTENWMENPVDEGSVETAGGLEGTNVTIKFSTSIPLEAPPITAYSPALEGSFDTQWPMIKVLLNSAGPNKPYSVLKLIEIISIELQVEVSGVKNLVIQNDRALLNPAKPYQLFGPQPAVRANFYIGNAEVFQKRLTSLSLNFEWHDLPITDDIHETTQLSDYYNAYEKPNSRSNDQFKVTASILNKKSWVSLEEDEKEILLFDEQDANIPRQIQIKIPSAPDKAGIPEKDIINTSKLSFQRDETLRKVQPYNVDSQRGFIRLRLESPDFGHHEYTNLYTRITAANAQADPKDQAPLPKQPYTPILSTLSLDYCSGETITLGDSVEQVFHIHPFGYTPYDYFEETPFLLPKYEAEGSLYIGLQHINPPQKVSILFQVSEGTSDPDVMLPEIKWSYLSENNWIDFNATEILSDSTMSFNRSGIITFTIPEKISTSNSLLPSGYFWLRGLALKNAAGACKIMEIRTQAATLEFVDQDNAPDHLAAPLSPKSITRLAEPDPVIKSVLQPYASFDGKLKEQDAEFYTRISERIRHKSRALTLWDYEHLILEKFPSLYKVKCFKHTSWEGGYKPGSLLIITLPDIRNNRVENTFQPLTNLVTMENIKAYTKTICPAYVNVDVKNPLFEEIKVSFLVKFRDGINIGFYQFELQKEIQQYLSPWAFGEGKDLNFGGAIYKSSLLNFVEERPYVNFVSFFEMDHYDGFGNRRVNVEEAVATTPLSILVSALEHDITVVQDESTLCADGIGHMIIEKTFITIK